ncbi:MAG: hypothetical protein ABFD18_06365 [Syntrophomonas sp.]
MAGTERLNACWKYFGPPKRLAHATFENYIPKTKQQAAALNICQSYCLDKILTGQGLMLVGSWGSGKSHLSVATARSLIQTAPEKYGVRQDEQNVYNPDNPNQIKYEGIYCSFFSVVELLDALRPGSEAKQRRGEALFHRAKADQLVVLDDIGVEKPTDWVAERLYAVVDTRYRMERATIFTSNCSEKELTNQLGGRLVSRIYEMAEPVQVIGPDHRRKMA